MNKRVFGIDLGTTYSCIAYLDEHGKAVVANNAEGSATTPSVVYFETSENIVVGNAAKEEAVVHEDRVVSTIKRSMGDPNHRRTFDGKNYTPEEISSFILRKLVNDAVAATGVEAIEDVVITCPAYFGPTEVEATKRAGTIAGLNVLHVIQEPVAAAIAYGIDFDIKQNILVYDLGGGTFDVTLITIAAEGIDAPSTGGDRVLGGKDWDDAIVNYLASEFEARTGTPASQLVADLETYNQLLADAEKAKIALSSATKKTVSVQFGAQSEKIELTREKFDELTLPLLERTVRFTEEMVQRAKELDFKIEKLLLVGGSTYMPQVKERMAKFPFEVKQYDPNQAVAKGAALYAYREDLRRKLETLIRDGQDAAAAAAEVARTEGLSLAGLRKIVEQEITRHASKSFGVIVTNEKRQEVVSNLVVADDRLPCDIARRFNTLDDDQLQVDLRVMQNLQRAKTCELGDCDPVEPLGTAVLQFERPLAKGSPVEVTFKLSADGLLSLHGRDLTTGREVRAEFKTASGMTAEEVNEKRSRALEMIVT